MTEVGGDDETQPNSSLASNDIELENDTCDYDDDDLALILTNEETEIAQLQLPDEPDIPQEINDVNPEDDERIPRIDFKCVSCHMTEMVHYFGDAPPFVQGIQFVEDTYVMRDPFQAAPPRWQQKPEYFVALGAACVMCDQVVCKENGCSLFYTRTYCLPCASLEIQIFPLETQAKIRKQIADKEKK